MAFRTPEKIKAPVIALILLLVTEALAILLGYILAELFNGHALGLSYLAEDPSVRGNDLLRLLAASSGFNPIAGVSRVLPNEPVPYPPGAFAYLGFLALLPKRLGIAIFYLPYLLYAWVAVKIATAATRDPVERGLWLIAILLSYPVLYNFDRGNLDAYASICCFAFFVLLAGERPFSAATVLALAAALKIYPAALSILLLQRKPKSFLLFTALAVFLTLLSLWLLSETPISAFLEFRRQISNGDFCFGEVLLCFNLSAAVPFKILLASLVTLDWYPSFDIVASRLYPLAAIGISLAVFTIIFLRPSELWQSGLLLTIAMNLIPFMSYDYKLALYFGPLYLLLRREPTSLTQRASLLLVTIMISSFKWFSPAIHVWLHCLVQLSLIVAIWPSSRPIDVAVSSRAGKTAVCSASLAIILLAWNTFSPTIIRKSWAKSSWCPTSFAFDRTDPTPLWGHGWGAFDGPVGLHWRWTTAEVAKMYLPVGRGMVSISGTVALPPNSPAGKVNISSAGLSKASLLVERDGSERFSFQVNTSPAASETNTIELEFRAPSLVSVGPALLGIVISDLRMSGTCNDESTNRIRSNQGLVTMFHFFHKVASAH